MNVGNQTTTLSKGNQTTKLDLGAIQTEAMQSIELKVGANSIKIDATGVTIKGVMVKIEGTAMGATQVPHDDSVRRWHADIEGWYCDDQLILGSETCP